MGALTRGFVFAQIVGRNAVPLIGILFSGWPPGNVMLLYFFDTLLSLGVVGAGLGKSPATASNAATRSAVPTLLQKLAAVALACVLFAFAGAVVAIPLGMPIAIVLAATGFSFGEALRDRSFWIGIVVQCAFAAWSYSILYRALRTHTPAELQLKQRFGLILMRWVAMLAVCYFLAQFDFLVWLGNGKVALVLLVATYVAVSIAAEIAPDRVLREIPRDLLPADEPEPSARTAGGKREGDSSDRGSRRP